MQLSKIIKFITKWSVVTGLVGCLGIFGLLSLVFTLAYQSYHLTLNLDVLDKNYATTIQPYIDGFFAPERNPNYNYSWTKPQFSVTVPAVARRDYTLQLWSLRPILSSESAILKVGDDFTLSFTPPDGDVPQPITLVIPASAIKNSTLKLQFSVPAFQPPKDRRGELGLLVTQIKLEGLPRSGILPPRSVLGELLLITGLLYLVVWGLTRQTAWQLLGLLLPLGSGLYLTKYLTDNPLTFGQLLDTVLLNVERLLVLEYTILGILTLSRLFLEWRKGEEVEVARPDHLHSLTGLRYIAALMVLFYHLPIYQDIPDNLYVILHNGFTGVSLFFTLSGFVLCYNYFESMQKGLKGKIKQFWFARFARIYPMYLLALLINVCLIPPHLEPGLGPLLIHALALQSYSSDPLITHVFNKPAWSISTEFFFYLVFPLIILWGVRYLRRPWQVLLTGMVIWSLQIGVITLAGRLGEEFLSKFFYWSGPGRLSEFVLGVLAGRLFLFWRDQPITRPKLVGSSLLVAGLLALTLTIMGQDTKVFFSDILSFYRYGILFTPAFCVFMYWLARFPTRISRALGSPAMRLLGNISFGFYLLHSTVLDLFVSSWSAIEYRLSDYIIFAAILIITTITSIITYTWFETPLRLWLKNERSQPQSIKITDI
jgi:peptidoglycan/LPS O-acetylase OafA/YrhL